MVNTCEHHDYGMTMGYESGGLHTQLTRPGKQTVCEFANFCELENGHRTFVDLPIFIAWWIFPVRFLGQFTRPGMGLL